MTTQRNIPVAVKATQGQDAEFGCIEVAKNGTKFVNIVGGEDQNGGDACLIAPKNNISVFRND